MLCNTCRHWGRENMGYAPLGHHPQCPRIKMVFDGSWYDWSDGKFLEIWENRGVFYVLEDDDPPKEVSFEEALEIIEEWS